MDDKVNDINYEYRVEMKRKIIKYTTRFLLVFLVASGFAQIAVGLHTLLRCQQTVGRATCGINLKGDPCSKLAVPAYFGCAVILTTIFGLGCVGRRSTGIILFIILLTEICTAVAFIVQDRDSLNEPTITSLTDASATCFKMYEDKNMKACWKDILNQTQSCSILWESLKEPCSLAYIKMDIVVINTQSYEHMMKLCGQDISSQLENALTSVLNIDSPFMLAASVVYIFISCSLVYMHRWIRRRRVSQFGRPNIESNSPSMTSTDNNMV